MRWFILILIPVIGLFCTAARAEVPLLTPAQLQEAAKHIVVAEVQRIFTAEKKLNNKYVDTLFAIEVSVSATEKGKEITPKQMIFAKAWKMKKRERGWAGPSGQALIPTQGQIVRLYLTGANGSYDLLSPNGISIVNRNK